MELPAPRHSTRKQLCLSTEPLGHEAAIDSVQDAACWHHLCSDGWSGEKDGPMVASERRLRELGVSWDCKSHVANMDTTAPKSICARAARSAEGVTGGPLVLLPTTELLLRRRRGQGARWQADQRRQLLCESKQNQNGDLRRFSLLPRGRGPLWVLFSSKSPPAATGGTAGGGLGMCGPVRRRWCRRCPSPGPP